MKILDQNQEVKNIIQKTKVLKYVIFLSFVFLSSRLFYLQIVKGEDYKKRSKSNFTLTEKIFPPRGDILSSDGKLLATTQPSYKISVVPLFFSKNENLSEQVDRLSSVLELSYNEKERFFNRISACRGSCKYMPLLTKDEIPRDNIVKLSSYLTNFPGVIISSSYKRVYPFKEKTAHITGYVSKINSNELLQYEQYDPEDFIGKTGIEKNFQSYLHGQYGEISHVIDHIGRKIEIPENVKVEFPKDIKAKKGGTVISTIKTYLHETAHEAFGNYSGSAVVLEVHTGKILALYSSPSFDPNLLSRKRIPARIWNEYSQSILRPLTNKAIQQTYYPGSTFKSISALASLHYNIVTPEKTFFCAGCLIMGNETKCCWNRGGHHYVSLRKAIKESCDIYFYHLANDLDIEKLTHFASLFQLGKPTGIQLPGEVSGVLPNREWFTVNHPSIRITKGVVMNIAIGQGDLRTTPLQLAVMYAALANNGLVLRPRIVEKIISDNGEKTEIPTEVIRVLDIDSKHFHAVNRALYSVANESGGTAFYSADRTIPFSAGKTGTSQIISLASRKRIDPADDERLNMTLDDALYTAFFPYENPEIAVVVVVENGEHGGSVAAPIAYKLMKSYYLKKSIER
jgi:penicillin-binding protein 2